MSQKVLVFALSLSLCSCFKKRTTTESQSNHHQPNIQPSADWASQLVKYIFVSHKLYMPIYPWFPDGHISMLFDSTATSCSQHFMFWSEIENINQEFSWNTWDFSAQVTDMDVKAIGKVITQRFSEDMKNKRFYVQGNYFTREEPLTFFKKKFPDSIWWQFSKSEWNMKSKERR